MTVQTAPERQDQAQRELRARCDRLTRTAAAVLAELVDLAVQCDYTLDPDIDRLAVVLPRYGEPTPEPTEAYVDWLEQLAQHDPDRAAELFADITAFAGKIGRQAVVDYARHTFQTGPGQAMTAAIANAAALPDRRGPCRSPGRITRVEELYDTYWALPVVRIVFEDGRWLEVIGASTGWPKGV